MSAAANHEKEDHAPACEIEVGFELEPACTCGLDQRRALQRDLALVSRQNDLLRAALLHIAETCIQDPDSAQFAARVIDGSAFPPGWSAVAREDQ